jgi:hypothetical protein
MRKLLIALVAAAAFAAPASAIACRSHHGSARLTSFTHRQGGGDHDNGVLFAKVTGTGTSFGGGTATASGSSVGNNNQTGTWSASLSTTWSSATPKTWTHDDGDNDGDDGTFTVSCAPATASLTLTNGSTTTSSLTGKTCSWTANGTTTYAFIGTDSTHSVRAFLKEDSSGNVTGAVVTRTNDGDNDNGRQGNGGGLHLGLFMSAHFKLAKHHR